MMLANTREDVARGVTAFHARPDRDGFLATFSRPVVVMSGADDHMLGLEISREQAGVARRAELYVVPNCGHYLPLEQPAYLTSVLRKVIADQQAPAR